jgi:hypothetical protein
MSGTCQYDEPQWRCTVCGKIGTVGRCCGVDTREPLNVAANDEAQRERFAKLFGIAPQGDTDATRS